MSSRIKTIHVTMRCDDVEVHLMEWVHVKTLESMYDRTALHDELVGRITEIAETFVDETL
jgi:hypothetical protein